MLKKSIYYIAVLSIVLGFGDSIQAQQTFVANLSAAQQIPVNNSNGKAVCTVKLDQTGTRIELSCNYSNLSSGVTFVRIHGNASVGETAPTLLSLPFNNGGQSGGFTGNVGTSSPQLIEILANKNYISFYTANFPNGEIRGQIHLANGTYNDFDGDGRTDLTVYRNSNNTFYAQSSLNGNLFARPIGQPGDSVSLTLDFDGDGKSDFSTARYNANVLWRIYNSGSETLQETLWGSSTLGDFFAAAVYDGDRRADIAVFRAGVWYIIESSTGNYRYEYYGASGDIPAANDFDKDGKADLTVARSENGTRVWYVRRSSDNQAYAVQWGLSSDGFFTGRTDWDGDGAADLTVIRSENGQRVFYIRRSSDSQLQIIRWGATSDVVKLGDYDGDGKTDAAVTRAIAGNRVFFILQSSNGAFRTETFGLQGDF